jgi:hypothetical protein
MAVARALAVVENGARKGAAALIEEEAGWGLRVPCACGVSGDGRGQWSCRGCSTRRLDVATTHDRGIRPVGRPNIHSAFFKLFKFFSN